MLEHESPNGTTQNPLEFEWRRWYEASLVARAEYHALAADRSANADMLDVARERLDLAEAAEARIMAKMERAHGARITPPPLDP